MLNEIDLETWYTSPRESKHTKWKVVTYITMIYSKYLWCFHVHLYIHCIHKYYSYVVILYGICIQTCKNLFLEVTKPLPSLQSLCDVQVTMKVVEGAKTFLAKVGQWPLANTDLEASTSKMDIWDLVKEDETLNLFRPWGNNWHFSIF